MRLSQHNQSRSLETAPSIAGPIEQEAIAGGFRKRARNIAIPTFCWLFDCHLVYSFDHSLLPDSLRCTGKSADAILPPFMKLDPSYQALASDFLATHRSTLREERLEAELIRIQHISANVASLANKRVLDLGCGSAKNMDSHWNPIGRLWQRWIRPKEFARFQPWYCRILQEAGAQPVGIDIRRNAGERFESHSMDLSDPTALERFPDESFDHANNYFLTVPKNSMHARSGTSPSIWLSLAWKHRFDNYNQAKERGIPLEDIPKFYERQNWKRMWAINDGIFLQVQRLLKEGGVYTLAEFAYRKKKGALVREKQIPQSLRPQPLPRSRSGRGAGSSTKSVREKIQTQA